MSGIYFDASGAMVNLQWPKPHHLVVKKNNGLWWTLGMVYVAGRWFVWSARAFYTWNDAVNNLEDDYRELTDAV